MAKILIVDDEPRIRELIREHLEHEGFQCEEATDGSAALAALAASGADLVILDIMMPFVDGMTCLREMRKRKIDTPVIMLTARGEEYDKLAGLEGGADDYVVKPFNPMELGARVKSQRRRYTDLGDINTRSDTVIVNGRLTFTLDEHVLYADGEPVKLTATETKIVELLMKHPGRIFPAEEIYSRIWNEPAYSAENTVMVHIRRIREKIELNPSEPEYLKVVWGIGYEIEKH